MGGSGRWTIVLVSTASEWGGGEDQALLLARGLRDRDHRFVLLCRRGSPLGQHMAAEGFEVHGFAGRGRNPQAWWAIRRVLRRTRPDVLHANDAHALWAGGLASLGLGIPLRVAARRVAFPLRFGLPYRVLVHVMVCVSEAAAHECQKAGVPTNRLRVVHDGVDPARVLSGDRRRGRLSVGALESDRVLLTVAKLTDCKGHRFLLEALPRVLSREPHALCVLAGDGELRGELIALANQLGIGNRVRWLGFRRDVPDLIQAADLFVLPSHTEGLCSTLIEAMVAGCPIAATTAGGIAEVLGVPKDGSPATTAWLAPPRDAQALAQAILNALEAPPAERAARTANARRRAQQLFTAQRMVSGTLAVYAEFLRNSPPEEREHRPGVCSGPTLTNRTGHSGWPAT